MRWWGLVGHGRFLRLLGKLGWHSPLLCGHQFLLGRGGGHPLPRGRPLGARPGPPGPRPGTCWGGPLGGWRARSGTWSPLWRGFVGGRRGLLCSWRWPLGSWRGSLGTRCRPICSRSWGRSILNKKIINLKLSFIPAYFIGSQVYSIFIVILYYSKDTTYEFLKCFKEAVCLKQHKKILKWIYTANDMDNLSSRYSKVIKANKHCILIDLSQRTVIWKQFCTGCKIQNLANILWNSNLYFITQCYGEKKGHSVFDT